MIRLVLGMRNGLRCQTTDKLIILIQSPTNLHVEIIVRSDGILALNTSIQSDIRKILIFTSTGISLCIELIEITKKNWPHHLTSLSRFHAEQGTLIILEGPVV